MEPIVNGIPLIALVISLVEWIKRFGVSGVWLNVTSMLVGVVIGIAYWATQNELVTFSDWFGAIIYGLFLGLIASGLYDAAKSVFDREQLL